MVACNIGDAGAEALSVCVKGNTTLKEIDLRGCNITNDGARSIIDCLQTNKTVQKIDLDSGMRHRIYKILSDEATERKKNWAEATTPAVECPMCGAAWPGAQPSSEAWVAVARQADVLESVSRHLAAFDDAQQALDAAVLQRDIAARDAALDHVVSSIRALPANVEGLSDLVATLGQPDSDVANPDSWRKILAVYDAHHAAKLTIAFHPTMHAHGAASLRAEIGACSDFNASKLAKLREEADQLESDRLKAAEIVKDLTAAKKVVKKMNQACRAAKRALEDIESDSDDEEEDALRVKKEREVALSVVNARRAEAAAATVEKERIQTRIGELAETYWPELTKHMKDEFCGVQLVDRKLDDYDEVEIMASSHNTVISARAGDRRVILKQLAAGEVSSDLRALQRLSQVPGIVEVTAIFRDRGGVFVEMPRYRYVGLLEWVQAHNPSTELRLRVARRLLTALAAVHLAGIVHCDVKPENVFVNEQDEPVLGDFDVSCDPKGRTSMLIARTSVYGTLGYIAPEVPGGLVSSAADVYSMGVIFLQHFVDGFQVGQGDVSVPQQISEPLRSLLLSMISASPEARPTALAATQHTCFKTVRDADFVIPPTYWTIGGGVGVHYEKVNKTEMQGLFDRTTTGQRFVVDSVQRVENMQLWKKYAARLEHVNEAASITVNTAGFGAGLRTEVNEVYLFHGTKQRLVSKIVRDGFDNRLDVGRGASFAEDVDKSYAEDVMFVSRVVLGRAFVTSSQQINASRPPCTSGHFDECNHPRADSLIAQANIVSPHREFVIYDLHQAYPEFIVKYHVE